jgi:hypothetical protein
MLAPDFMIGLAYMVALVTYREPVPPPPDPPVITEAVTQAHPQWLEDAYESAGIPSNLRAPLARIAWCESRWRPDAVGDGGLALGLHQVHWGLWFDWALSLGLVTESERTLWADAVVNSKVALGVIRYEQQRGQRIFGNWTCRP